MIKSNSFVTSAKMLSYALQSNDQYFEVTRGEKKVSVFINGNGSVFWYVNDKDATEESVTFWLKQWQDEEKHLTKK